MRRRRRRNLFALWLARISALAFVTLYFLLAIDDIKTLLQNYPVVINFLVCSVVIGLVISGWNKHRTTGILFMFFALIFLVLNWDNFLKVDIALSSLWLFLIGFLFLVARKKRRRRRMILLQPKEMGIQYAHTVSSTTKSTLIKKPKKAHAG